MTALGSVLVLSLLCAEPALSEQTASDTLQKAVTFFRSEVAVEGSYLWRYSADLTMREGEVRVPDTAGYVQPPGTPHVGLAYLRAYKRTGDTYLLDAATETGIALARGQLRSGGWDYQIQYDPKRRKEHAYRIPPGNPEGKNVSTLDDDTTQSAVRFLIALDKTLEQKDARIHDAVVYALDALIQVQYPNGAWPQRFSGPADPEKFPVKRASYPETWSREYPGAKYTEYYTFNDNTIADTLDVMLDAWDTYGDARYRESALKCGDFMLLAQMPDPQPAWAQQYNADMQPAWARKFEPPSITGGESQGVIAALIVLAQRTGEMRFLDAVPRAIAYFQSSLLPDGRLARFYELHTNKPLFFTKDYQLTYDSSDVPTHYGFFSNSRLDQLRTMYDAAKTGAKYEPESMREHGVNEAAVREAMESIDKRGAWVTRGRLRTYEDQPADMKTIECAVFVRNIDTLSAYIEATKKREN